MRLLTRLFSVFLSFCVLLSLPAQAQTQRITVAQDGSRTYKTGQEALNTVSAHNKRPEGWHNWDKPTAETTTLYAEYQSTGPRTASTSRVGWSKQLTAEEIKNYTVERILAGADNWNPNQTK